MGERVSRDGKQRFSSAADFAAWLDSSELDGCRELVLWDVGLRDEHAEVLAQSPVAARLDFLDVSCNMIGARGAKALAESPHLRDLPRLRLYHNDIGPEGVRAVADAPWPLTFLNMCGNGLGVEGVAALCRSRTRDRLESLAIGADGLGDEGASLLASVEWPALKQLNVRLNDIGRDGALALLGDAFPVLEYLGLDDNTLHDADLAAMRSTKAWSRIARVNLKGTDIHGQ